MVASLGVGLPSNDSSQSCITSYLDFTAPTEAYLSGDAAKSWLRGIHLMQVHSAILLTPPSAVSF